MILEPGNIHIAWGLDKVSKQRVGPYGKGRHGALVEPTMDFCMSVSEGEPASAMMVHAWEITVESRCHAWSASPVFHLMQQILGVMPIEPGWRTVRIAPFADDLDFAKGTVPSPHGKIRVEWEKAGPDQLACRIDVPPGIKAEFVSPLGDSRTLKTGMNEFHT